VYKRQVKVYIYKIFLEKTRLILYKKYNNYF
jgi:hypothetical protein